MSTSIGITAVFLICVTAFGCSTKDAPIATEQVKAVEHQTSSAEKVPSSKTPTSKVEDSETYSDTSLEVLFSRVLSRGFRKASARNNISVKRCRAAMIALVSRGDTSRRFLETKLADGSLSEKVLALWSLGSMGPNAAPAQRTVVKAMSRSWLVPIARCQANGGNVATCMDRTFAKAPSWTIHAGCRALETFESRKGVEQVAQQGLRGKMSLPCLPLFIEHSDLASVRERLIESYDLPEVSKALRAHFEQNPKVAFSMAMYWLRREKHKAEVEICPLERALGAAEGKVMSSLSGRLHAEELNSLKTLGENLGSAKLKDCAARYAKALGPANEGALLKNKAPEKVSETNFFSVGEFCPEKAP